MEVYIEYAIIDNMVLNSVILYLTGLFMGIKLKKRRILFSATFGTIISLIVPVLNIPLIFQIISKVGLAIIMVLFISKSFRIKKYLQALFVFIFVTAMMGGLCYGFITMIGVPISGGGLIFNDFSIPMGMVLLLVLFSVWILRCLVQVLSKKMSVKDNYIDVDIRHGTQCIHCVGYIDSGNFATTPDGQALIFLSPRAFCKLFPKVDMAKFVMFKLDRDINGSFYQEIQSTGSTHRHLVVPVDEVDLGTKDNRRTYRDVDIAIASNNFAGEFDLLLSPKFISGGDS